MRFGVLTVALSMTVTTAVLAQTPTDATAKSNAIAASFSKFKSLSKEKRGVRKEKYLRVESAPAVVANPADYSGTYRVPDMQFQLDLRIIPDGSFTGSGYEPLNENVKRTFTLQNGRIRGSLATATKVYADGATESFEGAFMNRSVYESPTDKGVTVFGFGTLTRPFELDGLTIDKLFYDRTK